MNSVWKTERLLGQPVVEVMGPSTQTVIPFPAERVPRAAPAGASRMAVALGRLRQTIGRALNGLGAPAAIRDVTIKDALTGQTLTVKAGELLVRVSVNGRDYYFDRVTGRFDGTGAAP